MAITHRFNTARKMADLWLGDFDCVIQSSLEATNVARVIAFSKAYVDNYVINREYTPIYGETIL